MRSKIALRKIIRKLILAGLWTEAERLMREQEDITYYEKQSSIKRLEEEELVKSKVVSLADFKRLKSLRD